MSEWDEIAAGWDQGAPVVYAEAAFESLLHRLGEIPFSLEGARVLDFGCGTGLLSERLASEVAEVVAMDPSRGMVAVLEEKIAAGLDHVTPVLGSLDSENLASRAFEKPFDLVVASSVFAFVEDFPVILCKLSGLLRPGGVLVHWDWELNPEDEEPYGLTRQEIMAAMCKAGLRIRFLSRGFEATFEEMVMSPLMGVAVKEET